MSRLFAAVAMVIGVAAVSACAAPSSAAPQADAEVLHEAEQMLVRRCMERQGLKYFPVPRTQVPDVELFPHVVDDVNWARTNGYGRAHRQKLSQAAAPNAHHFRGLPKERQRAWLAALHGDPSSRVEARLPDGNTVGHSDRGCSARAWQDLYGDVAQWYRVNRFTETVGNMRIGRTQADPAYKAALKRWRACMEPQGFTSAAPMALRSRRLAGREADAVTRDRSAATAEARCALSSGLAKTARDLDEANADLLEARYRAEFETAARLRAAALPRARALAGTR